MTEPTELADPDFYSVICTRLFGLQHQAVLIVDGEPKLEGPWRWSQTRAITDSVSMNFVHQLIYGGDGE